MRDIQHVFGPIRNDVAALLERFDTQQLTAIAEFLTGSTDLAYRHVALLRAQATAQTPDLSGTTGRSVRSPIPVGSEPKTRQAHKQKAKP
jgi:hypothetical protein